MYELTIDQMAEIDGEGFWEGFLCGAGIVGSIAATFSPDPMSKVALWTIYSGTAGVCGLALF